MMMQNKFLVLIALFLSIHTLHAIDIVTEYRTNGLKNIQKKLDSVLASQKYWEKYLQDKNTQFGYLETYQDILVCNKDASTLTLYIKDKNNTYKKAKEYSAYTGKLPGDKEHRGDLRTPIGIYTLVKKIEKVDSFYGPMAFVTSYPNSYDKYKGKDGSGIWIHGLPTDQKRDSFTKGCIAINNNSIECLDRHIDIKKTLLIINQGAIQTNISKKTLASLLAQLYKWRYTWVYSDVEKYLDFYDSKFVRFDGMDIKRFRSYKTRIFKKKEQKEIIFNDINIVPYPGTPNLYKISFHEIYHSNSFHFEGDKILIAKFHNNHLKIVTEQ